MENKENFNLDNSVEALKNDQPSPEQAAYARSRVWDRLNEGAPAAAPERLRSVEDFQALLIPYIKGELSEARRMLVEDHLSKDPASRRRLEELRGNVRTMAPGGRRGVGSRPSFARPSFARPFVPWAIAAGVLLVAAYLGLDSLNQILAPSGPRAELASVSGEIFKVSAAGLVPVKAGEPLQEKEVVRTAKASSAVVRLPDGSLIEMNERAELSISGAFSGSTIRLDRGNIVVQAAKQKRGSLKVATRDSVVNVKGTIFAVATGLRGTQVAVVEGHVVVDQNGKTEDLIPGQLTASDAALKRSSVQEQISWSKDQAKYLALLGEFKLIEKQLASLPLPALRTQSKLLASLPAGTALYAAIPNLTGSVADATRIFESRFQQSPVLAAWWKSDDVGKLRDLAEQLRQAGTQIGDEIIIAAPMDAKRGLGEPFILAEVKGPDAKRKLEEMYKALQGDMPLEINERYLTAGAKVNLSGGFAGTELGKTVLKSYSKGAGWILALDLEQIAPDRVLSDMGMNMGMRHLMVERRDGGNRPDTRATLSFASARKGIASWIAAPAPMASLDYISPQAGFALSAVTKDARQMGEEFFALTGAKTSQGLAEAESHLGLKVLDDLLGPFGGELTLALDGPLLPVPTVVMVAEVYDSGRLNTSLKRVVAELRAQVPSAAVELLEETAEGRTWYRLKAKGMPSELHFTYDSGYVIAAPSRLAITKALQNRRNGNGLARSTAFRQLLPADSQVNMSGVLYYNLGPGLKSIVDQMKSIPDLPAGQSQSLDALAANQEPVLIGLWAENDRLTVASSTGFFGLGLENFVAAAGGQPILPSILGSALRQTAPFLQQGNR